MLKNAKYEWQHFYWKFWVRLIVSILLGSLFLAACGTPPSPTHPLSSNDTPTVGDTTTTPETIHMKQIQMTSNPNGLVSYPGGTMTMTISTNPYAVCSFVVNYGRSTPSVAIGVVPHTADAHGVTSWTWKVDGDAHTGDWPLMITAEFTGKAKTTSKVNVTITLPPISVVAAQTIVSGYPKSNMMLTIATAPSVVCVLTLNYGPSRPVKYLKTGSDSNGIASWSWKADTSALAGTWPLTITVTLADGEQAGSQVNMAIL